MAKAQEMAGRLEALAGEMASLLEGLPPGLVQRPPREGEWSVAQVVGHTAEMLGFWTRRCIRAAQGEEVAFYRATPEERRVRLEWVEAHARDDAPALQALLMGEARRASQALRGLGEEALERTGRGRDGEAWTVATAIQRLLLGHLEEHLRQVREALAALGEGGPR